MKRCRAFDQQLMADAEKAGGRKYAELLALTYRHSITAHKLLTDKEGNLLFLSKENHSNGCINTVDLTYPSAPLYLIYNTELMKGMLNSIFYYSESGRWNKPYPAHDLGTYPIANGQLYGEDMPIELAFDKPGTWSQKYNLIWDKVFNMNIFPQKVFDTEIPFYLTKQNKYGLLLDSRAQYTKSDWVLWSACMSPDDATFQKFIDPIYTYANETTSRVPISDWHDTNTGKMMNFKARSVVGGYYMKLLMEKVKEQK